MADPLPKHTLDKCKHSLSRFRFRIRIESFLEIQMMPNSVGMIATPSFAFVSDSNGEYKDK
jgi:hypothetical protein